jgi:hypothetical protein
MQPRCIRAICLWLPVSALLGVAMLAWPTPADASVIYCTTTHNHVCSDDLCCGQFCRYCFDTDTEELVSQYCTDPECYDTGI